MTRRMVYTKAHKYKAQHSSQIQSSTQTILNNLQWYYFFQIYSRSYLNYSVFMCTVTKYVIYNT